MQGMSHSVQYTTIPDMRLRLRTNTERLSYAMAVGTAGGLLGGPTASLADRLILPYDVVRTSASN